MTIPTDDRTPLTDGFGTERTPQTRKAPAAVRVRVAPSILAPAAVMQALIQASTNLAVRRTVYGLLVGATVVLLAAWLVGIVATDGFSLLDLMLLIAFLGELPWTVHNAWNALLGLVFARTSRDPVATICPSAARAHDDDPIFARTAILMTLRNEDCVRAFARIKAMKASLDATGHGGKFDFFILSDSNEPEAIAAEEAAMKRWRAEVRDPGSLYYRRRKSNVGFKAGNVYDFCQRWGANYEFMLPLDADSLMSGKAILRLVRIMQANPRLGILQSLIAGTPSKSLFERILHFGPRPGARLFILGGSWWQGDSGPFWGHNAVIRVAPFTEHCRLPILRGKPPLGGHVLSHDQLEAVLMRRGGYEVRVLPEETESYEDNPPTVPDYLRRHLRWCQGNLQYLKLRHIPGLLQLRASRFYLWLALELFFSMAGMVAFVALAAIAAATWPAEVAFPVGAAAALYLTWMVIYFMPKLVGLLDACLFEPARYGGRVRLLVSGAAEIIATFLLVPIANFASSVFMIGLLFGRKVTWNGQRRDGYKVPWTAAAAGLWPQTLFGGGALLFLAYYAPASIPWFLPFLAGLVGAVPFTVLTSLPLLGELAARWKFVALPEEFDTPPELATVLRASDYPLAEREPEKVAA